MLATGQRLQTIAPINIKNIKEDENDLRNFIPDLIKTSGPKRPQPCQDFRYFQENKRICVATLLKAYLVQTESLRSISSDTLFLSHKTPHKPVSKQTLSRWVKGVLKDAGINTDIFQAHSVRMGDSKGASSVINYSYNL